MRWLHEMGVRASDLVSSPEDQCKLGGHGVRALTPRTRN